MPRGTGGLRRSSRVIRTTTWIVLVVGGIFVTFYGLVNWHDVWVGVAMLVVASWVIWGLMSSYVFGVRRHVLSHLQISSDDAEVIKQPIPSRQRADLQRALDAMHDAHPQRPAGRVFGLPAAATSLATIIRNNAEPRPFEWDQFPSGPGKTMRCPRGVLYLLRHQGRPF